MKSINKSMNNKNDERYTPPILVEPILKYIKPNSTKGSDHYLIPKDEFKELFNEMINWKEESKKQKDRR